MRIPSILALCLAIAVSLSATGQTAPAQSTSSQNSSAPCAAQKAATPTASAQTASQPDKQDAQAPKPRPQRTWPQMSFDKGIYVGRNNVNGDGLCLAIQSYNFSQGQSPKLESITTCTTVERPLWRLVQKPESQNQQGQGNRQIQSNQQAKEKDQK